MSKSPKMGLRGPMLRLTAAPFLIALVFLLDLPCVAQAVPTLRPGETHLFTDPDGVDGDCTESEVLLLAYGAACGVASPPSTPLSGFVEASRRFRRASYEVFQYNEFTVDATSRPGSLLLAQVSGKAFVRGFLAIVGVGQTSSDVVLKLLDVTNDPDNGEVVKAHTISRSELEGSFDPGLGLDLKVEGGAPYIGVGGGNKIDFKIKASKKLVRANVDFGFDTLLRRGHTYRLQLESKGFAKMGAMPGLAVASFGSLLDTIPNVIDRTWWLDALGPVELPRIPIIHLPPQPAFVPWSADIFIPNPPCPERIDEDEPYDCTVTDVLDFLDFPTTLDGILDRIEARRADRLASDDTNDLEDRLDRLLGGPPGVQLSALSVTIQEDPFEAFDRGIEENLRRGVELVSLYLPEANGGRLEAVTFLVESLIERSDAAGLQTGNARRIFDHAVEDFNGGRYKRSYLGLSKAYRLLIALAR